MLLDAGADANQADENGKTPLHACADDLYLEAMRLLLEKGAAVDAKDEDGTTGQPSSIEVRSTAAARHFVRGSRNAASTSDLVSPRARFRTYVT